MNRTCLNVLLALWIGLSLSACGGGSNNNPPSNGGGGGGGGGDEGANTPPPTAPEVAPAAPVLSLAYNGTKAFQFSWPAVSGATQYRLLENSDGISGYTQVAATSSGSLAYDINTLLVNRVNAKYILQACNAAGCADSAPASVAPTLTQAITYIKSTTVAAGNRMGNSIALSADGTTMAVGAPKYSAAFSSMGAVHIFTRSGATWTERQTLTASDASADSEFGFSVSLSADGNTLAIGARPLTVGGIGKAYVFTRSGGTFAEEKIVQAFNAEAQDQFGYSISLSGDGNTLAVGAKGEDSSTSGVNDLTGAPPAVDNAVGSSGAVYVYTRGGGAWPQQAYIKSINPGSNDQFSESISLSYDGNTLAVGAPMEDSTTSGIDSAPNDSAGFLEERGAAYVYTRTDGIWDAAVTYIKADVSATSQQLGCGLSLSSDGTRLALSGCGNSVVAPIHVYTFNGTAWSFQTSFAIPGAQSNDYMGRKIVLSSDGNTLAVGGYGEDSITSGINTTANDSSGAFYDSGAAHVFTYSGGTWLHKAYLKASNTGAVAQFGTGLSISGDGRTLAIGAPRESGSAPGSGAVYIY